MPYFDGLFRLEKHIRGVKTSKRWRSRLTSMFVFKETEENRLKALEANKLQREIEALSEKKREIVNSMERYEN